MPSLVWPRMNTDPDLRGQLKALVAETLMLSVPAMDIGDEQALFGPESLGLDSVDALQLVVMLDKHFGLKISDAEAARSVLRSVSTMALAIEQHASGGGPAKPE